MTSFIMVLVVGVLTLLMVTASRSATQVGDRHVLEYSVVWRWLVRAFWLFPIVIALVGIFSGPDPGERWIPVAIILGFTAICLPLTLEVFRRRIELSESGISQKSAWSQPLTIAWNDVRDVAWKHSGDIDVLSKRGKRVRVSVWLSGMDTFAEALETHLAHVPSTAVVVKRILSVRV
jgi:hypothetical protein